MNKSSTAYNSVARALRERILAGKQPSGSQLPAERQLCEQFGASRITIRRALHILQEEMLLQRRQGSGTFVSPSPTRKIPILNADFAGSIQRHAPELTRRLIEISHTKATPRLAGQLDVPAGAELMSFRRLDELRGQPVALDEVYLPREFSAGVNEKDLLRIDFLDRWMARLGLKLEYSSQTIEAIEAPRDVASLLRINRGRPLLRATELIFAGGRAVGLFVTFYRADQVRLTSTTSWTRRDPGGRVSRRAAVWPEPHPSEAAAVSIETNNGRKHG